MGKKSKEYKSGDFVFAKVKGYPAWPARVQRPNGKKYYVYFYGTGETANLPANMIFDYMENKDKFLTKNVKRRDFNDGVKQIEHDFVNNVPLELVIGAQAEAPDAANETANDTGNDTMEDSAMDTTAADETVADSTAGTANATQNNDTAVEDSDDAGALVIDEGKQLPKNRKSKVPEPAKTPKTPKTPRGKAKKEEEVQDKKEEEDKSKEELVSRSGRKIRPKRYIDEQTEENATLPSPAPAPKKRRGASPAPEKEKDAQKEKGKDSKEKTQDKNLKQYNNVSQLELEELKEPFKPADPETENILIAYLPSGQYVGIKVFQSRPTTFKDEAARLQWDKQAASNALTLKNQLERGHITAQSIIAQLVMDLNLTDEEKAALDKDRETEEKKSRVQFLKTEMKLIELDAKIKSCLSLEKADVDSCLKLLDELLELDIKPLMLLKHPCCLETVKRMRSYVGNTPRWQLTESEALQFAASAASIRKQADTLYQRLKELCLVPGEASFWEHFQARLQQFQKATATLSADRLLEMVHEPAELCQPNAVTMQTAIDEANKEEPPLEQEAPATSNNSKPAKKSANNNTPAKATPKRQSSRSNKHEEKKQTDKKQTDKKQADKKQDDKNKDDEKQAEESNNQQTDKNETQKEKQTENSEQEKNGDENHTQVNDSNENEEIDKTEQSNEKTKKTEKKLKETDKKTPESDKKPPESDKKSKESNKKSSSEKKLQETDKKSLSDKKSKENDKTSQETDEKSNEAEKEISEPVKEPRKKKEVEQEAQKEKEDEPRAKRSRSENKKTDPPPRSPAKRKSKA